MNGDGELELFEWLEMAAIVFLGKDEEELKDDVFKLLASKEAGTISPESLVNAWKRTMRDAAFTEEDARKMILKIGFDPKEKGRIHRDEFDFLLRKSGVAIEMPK